MEEEWGRHTIKNDQTGEQVKEGSNGNAGI